MMPTIKASTPEATRDEIVKWLKMNASNHRIKASNARLVYIRNEETTMAIAYQDAADYIARMVIESIKHVDFCKCATCISTKS